MRAGRLGPQSSERNASLHQSQTPAPPRGAHRAERYSVTRENNSQYIFSKGEMAGSGTLEEPPLPMAERTV